MMNKDSAPENVQNLHQEHNIDPETCDGDCANCPAAGIIARAKVPWWLWLAILAGVIAVAALVQWIIGLF